MIDWGSVPDWFAGVGAVAALAFAAVAVRAANRTNVQQGKQLALFEEDRRRAQAEAVGVWPTIENHIIGVRIQNESKLPVLGAVIFFGVYDAEEMLWWRCAKTRVIPPGATFLPFDDSNLPFAPFAEEPVLEYRLASLVFLDASGQTWLRNSYGVLKAEGAPYALYDIPVGEWVPATSNEVLRRLTRAISG